MFEGFKDREAAEAAFLAMFTIQENRLRNKLIYLFVKNFKRGYNDIFKSRFMDKSQSGNYVLIQVGYIFGHILERLRILNNSKPSREVAAETLGKCMGEFLCCVEHGLTTDRIAALPNLDDIIREAESIAQEIKQMGKSVKIKLIKNRIEIIARRHAGKISQRQRVAIARIASYFV